MSGRFTRTLAVSSVAGALALGAASCGGVGGAGRATGDVSFELYVSRAAIDEIGAFQLALVKSEAELSCAQAVKSCLIGQGISPDQLVRFEDAEGRSHVALTVPAALTSAEGVRTQDTTLRKVPAGNDYFLIVEALSRHDPPRFLGGSCRTGVDIKSGENQVLAEPIQFVPSAQSDGGVTADGGLPGLDCDPRFEK